MTLSTSCCSKHTILALSGQGVVLNTLHVVGIVTNTATVSTWQGEPIIAEHVIPRGSSMSQSPASSAFHVAEGSNYRRTVIPRGM